MKVVPIEINWHSKLPIFASESFLKAVGDEYGWLGGFDENGNLSCILPYTIIHKALIKMVRFRNETIILNEDLDIQKEKLFLNKVVEYFHSIKADIIIPPSNNAIFRIYPDGAKSAPYGSFIIDLRQPEDIIWRNIDRITRQNIKKALRLGIIIREENLEGLKLIHDLIVETYKKSNLPFMSYKSLKRFVLGLSKNCKILIAEKNGIIQSCVIYGFSNYCSYAIYGGNKQNMEEGANKLLHWEAMRIFKNLGVQLYDFFGARINPEKGSKEESINAFKRRLGGKLKQGYIWKYPLRAIGSKIYSYAVKYLRGGDIVDIENYKIMTLLHQN